MKKYLFIAAVGLVGLASSCKTVCPAYAKADAKTQPVAKADIRG
ncbi:hypothetical protein [Adhaeribacter terreus]|uniref:Lipoprotein n=1 Tax=Adhaeribacter terreus TaxID=529703 RepID=A0ABW0EDL2_9BACT